MTCYIKPEKTPDDTLFKSKRCICHPAMLRRSLKPTIIESIPVLTRSKPKVWLEAYGCSASMADSEMISGLLRGAGYEIASKQSEVLST